MIDLQLFYQKLPEKYHKYFVKILTNEIERIDKHLRNYPHKILLKINAEQTKTSLYEIKAVLFFGTKTITTTHTGDTLRTVIEKIFDVLKQNLNKALDKRKDKTSEKIAYEEVPQNVLDLINFNKPQKQTTFSDELKKYLPSLQKYIKSLFKSSLNLNLDLGEIDPIEILQLTVEYALVNFTNFPSNLTYKQWLFQIANKILRKEIKKIYKNKKNISWEKLLNNEIKKLEEEIAIDADGDLQLATGPTHSNLSDEKEESDAKLPDELISE